MLMGELHAVSSCLKAFTTEVTCDGMEICRKACGGHGYSMFSGIIEAYQNYLPAQTYEGENTVLYMQTARYLIKNIRNARRGKPVLPKSSVSYLVENNMGWINERCTIAQPSDLANPEIILHALRARAGHNLHGTSSIMDAKIKDGMSDAQAWDESLVDLQRCGSAHAAYVVVKVFADVLKTVSETAIRTPLLQLFSLLGCTLIEDNAGDLLESGYMSGTQVRCVRDYSRHLLTLIRDNAVALVDAWGFSDHFLNSALGRYDGNVYQALYDWAKLAPLNAHEVPPGIQEHLLPLIHQKQSVIPHAKL